MTRSGASLHASLLASALLFLALPGCKSQLEKDSEACATGPATFPRAERCLDVCAKQPGGKETEAACRTVKNDVGDLCMNPWSEAHPATPAYLGGKADFKRWAPAQPQCAKLCDKVDAIDKLTPISPGSPLGDAQRDCEQTRKSSW